VNKAEKIFPKQQLGTCILHEICSDGGLRIVDIAKVKDSIIMTLLYSPGHFLFDIHAVRVNYTLCPLSRGSNCDKDPYFTVSKVWRGFIYIPPHMQFFLENF
jgi:hypothetical protein